MISPDDVRTLALLLPESEEQAHWGKPSFRTRQRIFATMQPDEHTAVLKLPLHDQDALVTLQPDVFALGGWSHQGWTRVDLRRVDSAEFRSLLILAWRTIATKRAIRAYEQSTQ